MYVNQKKKGRCDTWCNKDWELWSGAEVEEGMWGLDEKDREWIVSDLAGLRMVSGGKHTGRGGDVEGRQMRTKNTSGWGGRMG